MKTHRFGATYYVGRTQNESHCRPCCACEDSSRFNSGVNYKGHISKWDTAIEQKTLELSRFLIGKVSVFDFSEPAPKLEEENSRELRSTILSLSASQAKQLGINKSTLHYLRQNARASPSLALYGKTHKKLVDAVIR